MVFNESSLASQTWALGSNIFLHFGGGSGLLNTAALKAMTVEEPGVLRSGYGVEVKLQ